MEKASGLVTIHSDSDTQVLQRDLDKLAEWETLWKMEFHPDKCEVLRVGRKRAMVQNDYILHGKTLQTADSAKYLGVTIASDLRLHSSPLPIKRWSDLPSSMPVPFGIHTHRETSISSRWCSVGQRDLFFVLLLRKYLTVAI